ncbi:hypothetical protein AUEXF2481DRAFT_167689 [Aureobasidium subglaciale EXF-2481]|uniref:Amino acid permease/ SLC12A domain-containing protein n=1 Tax=Aureobasidium subglaciale (strain EXF-2481) TaxID=1043005 RepID=A0A074YTC3_AURSE|nr:uncharacterized protein AUEXF2481DRAFT_167689 [Aureobasidium subglaciale EXF-2481]KER00931.1 hypothetical protein AUEXF2481DRAFT_167689 [Aureobasidium subglaciale EXF-2481]
MMVVFCAISSVIVLLVSDGHRQKHWADKIGPNVLLSGFNGVSNICFGIAIGNGVAMESSQRRHYPGSPPLVGIWRQHRRRGAIRQILQFIALAALAAKLTIIDGILLQKAATTEVGPDRGHNTSIMAVFNSTMPFTGSFPKIGNTYTLDDADWFSSDLLSWANSNGILRK